MTKLGAILSFSQLVLLLIPQLQDGAFMQSDYLPLNLLYIAGKLGIGIELSHYAVSEDHDSEQIISADG